MRPTLSLLLLLGAASLTPAAERRPNFVLILADDKEYPRRLQPMKAQNRAGNMQQEGINASVK